MKRVHVVLVISLLFSLAASAQPPGPPGPGGFERGPRGMGMGPGMHPWKVITGAPYSATATDTLIQTLPDGNTITRTNTAQVARDSQGRTYIQRTITGMPGAAASESPVTVTSIFDPVAGYSYEIRPDKQSVVRRQIRVPDAGRAPGEQRMKLPEENSTTQTLPRQMINGVAAEGVTRTMTTPAGQIGNEKPIVRTSTVWTSPELQIPVQAVSTDPMHGQSTYVLTNINRAEPNPSLFQVPAGYATKDAPVHGRE